MALVITPGTTVEYSTDGGTTYSALATAKSIGAFGEEGSFIDVTTLSDVAKKYVGGMTDTPDIELVCYHDSADTALTGFIGAANSRTSVLMRLTFPSGETATFTLALSGYTTSAENEGVVTHTFKGKQSGGVTWA